MVFIMKLSPEHEAIVSRFKRSHKKIFHKVMTKGTVSATIRGSFAYQLEFPLQFLDDHSHEFNENATLVKPDCGKKWPLAVTVRDFKYQGKKRVFAYGDGGWRDFAIENDVKVGDLLIFILVGFSRFIVHIFPSGNNRDNDDHHEEFQETAPEEAAVETKCAACGQSPRCPLFVATVRPSNSYCKDSVGAKTRLDAPGGFWQRHRQMLRGDAIRLKGPNKAIMKVKFREYTHVTHGARVRLESGWKEFFMANKLLLGDQLLFSLTARSSFEVERMDRIP